jgi:Fe-S cluster biogenesis protein NfuA
MRVADWACSPGPDIPPYPRLRSVLPTGGTCFDFSPNVNCAVEGAACDKVFCDSWPPADRVANVWTDVGFENLSRCFKLGFKNAQAAKAWHGYFGLYSYDPSGWTYPLDLGGACASCSFEPEHSTPDGTKYLSIAVTATYTSTLGYSGECIRNMSVGRTTGVNTWDACSDSGDATGKAAAKGALDGVAGWPALWRSSDLVNLFVELFYIFSGTITGTYPTEASITYNDGLGTSYEASVSLSGGTFHHKQTDDASGSYDQMNVDLTNTHCHWTLTTFRHHGMDPDVTEVTDFTADLSNAYTSAEVYGDVQTLLARIDMADDVKYQWRTDPYVSVAPLVTYDEVLSPVAPSWNEDCDWVDPNTNGPDGNPRTGAVKGDLIDAGKDTFFDFDHLTWWMCTSDLGDILWVDYKFGAPSGTPIDAWTTAGDPTDTYVQGASQWTNNQQAAWLPNGAWIGMSGQTGDFGIQAPPDQLWGWAPGVLAAQKWAEVKISRPSINFFRPCGADRDAIDQTTIACDSNPDGDLRWPDAWPICGRRLIDSKVDVGGGVTEITLATTADYLRTGDSVDFTDDAGAVTVANKTVTVISATVFRFTGAIPAGTYVKSHGAPGWYWDDDNSKGDCGYATWTHNYRDYQERARVVAQYTGPCGSCAAAAPADATLIRTAQTTWMPQSVIAHTATAECLMPVPCCPSVLFIGPNPEVSGVDDFEHSVIKVFPVSFTSDQRYGAKWQGQWFQTMADPLWQAPHKACVDCGDGLQDSLCAKTEDDGTCQESVCDDCDAGGVTYFAHRPVVEWRMDLPMGGPFHDEVAPALPTGLTLHVITLAELQTGSPPDGRVLVPPSNLGYIVPSVVGLPSLAVPETPWNLFLNEQQCACGGGTGEFADQYEANGAVCPT